MITYTILIHYLKKQHKYPITLKSEYCVIIVPNTPYHVTIFQDQWDNYEKVSGKPYHLFHISSLEKENRCSSYFWVDNKTNDIKKIPKTNFFYNQPMYDFFSSTRNYCCLDDINYLLRIFQKILKKISIVKKL